MIPRLFVADLGIAVGGTASWLLHLNVHDWKQTFLLCAVVFVGHAVAWIVHLHLMLRPIQAWARGDRRLDDDELLALDALLTAIPKRLSVSYSLAWLGYFSSVALLSWFVLNAITNVH